MQLSEAIEALVLAKKTEDHTPGTSEDSSCSTIVEWYDDQGLDTDDLDHSDIRVYVIGLGGEKRVLDQVRDEGHAGLDSSTMANEPDTTTDEVSLNPSLSTCIDDYLAYCYTLAKSTQKLYHWHLSRLLDAVGDQPIKQVGHRKLRRFMANQRKKNGEDYSRAFMNQIYRTIHTFFEWVVDEGILSKNPLDRVRKPGYPKKKSPRLKEEELIRLFQAVKAHTQHPVRNLAIIRLMLDAGLRRGELCNLKLSRLDQERRCVRAFGKDKEDRDVPILEETLQAIRDWLGVRPEVDHDYIFTTREGNPMTGNALGLLLYRLKDKTGIPDLCCQLLRHTFANCYIKNGGSLRRLQKALGHSDVTTTAKIYLDPEFSEIQEEHKRVSPLANLDL